VSDIAHGSGPASPTPRIYHSIVSDFVNYFEGMASFRARRMHGRPDFECDLLPGAAELVKSLPTPLGYVPFGSNNRMHLDVRVRDSEVLAMRIGRLAARRVSRNVDAEHGSHWIVMAGPEDDESCSVMVAKAA